MAGFATRQAVVDALTAKCDTWTFFKNGGTPEIAGAMMSFWKATGMPGAGADPAGTPGAAYDSDSASPVAGSIYFPDRSTDIKHLISMSGTWMGGSTARGNLVLYDRLCGVGAISLATTGNKTVNSAALTRYTSTAAVDNEAWLEVTTATTVTAPVVNISSYTSSDGSNTLAGGSITFPAVATNVATLIPLPLHETERGVRSVETINVGTAATVGVANLIIVKRLATIPIVGGNAAVENRWQEFNFLDDFVTLPRIYDNACLGLAWITDTLNSFDIGGTLSVAYG